MPKKGKRQKEKAHTAAPGAAMQAAEAGLLAAQRSLDALREARDKAREEVRLASTAVEDAQRGKEHGEGSTDTYGEEAYWEDRYRRDTPKGAAATGSEQIYEWYLPYADLKPLLQRDIIGFDKNPRILVPGCGNSSLCEDLANDGM